MSLERATQAKQDLFDTRDLEKQKRLMQAVDAVNAIHGARTLRYAAMNYKPDWTTTADRLSPRFTTNWQELPKVKTSK